jgi:hypothetical protein
VLLFKHETLEMIAFVVDGAEDMWAHKFVDCPAVNIGTTKHKQTIKHN